MTLYWLNGLGASTAHFTYEGMRSWAAAVEGGSHGDAPSAPAPPTGVAVFAGDNSIRREIDPEGKIDHWSEFDRGGHFAAMEVPDLLVDDVRAFFRALR